jgi:putative PIN family toxin of toxin-antitoxin system
MIDVVIDTNVLISALRSQRGSAYRLLSAIGRSKAFRIHISVPLVMEYEAVAKREQMRSPDRITVNQKQIDAIIDYICGVGQEHEIFYLWRPILPDEKDDCVLEVAVAASAQYIITFNKRDFKPDARFGITLVTPQEFFDIIGEQS